MALNHLDGMGGKHGPAKTKASGKKEKTDKNARRSAAMSPHVRPTGDAGKTLDKYANAHEFVASDPTGTAERR